MSCVIFVVCIYLLNSCSISFSQWIVNFLIVGYYFKAFNIFFNVLLTFYTEEELKYWLILEGHIHGLSFKTTASKSEALLGMYLK